MGLAVIVTNLEGIILYWNRYLYGWHADEAVGRTVYEVTVPDTSAAEAAAIMQSLRAGEHWSGEFQVRHRDGRVFTAEVRNVPVVGSDGELEAIIGLSTDISSRLRLQAERDALIEKLTAANRAKDEFLGLISHELRTPITTILGFASILTRRRIDDPEIVQDALRDILDDARRLERIVSDLLALARTEKDAALGLEPVSLAAIVEKTIDAQRSEHPHRTFVFNATAVGPVQGQEFYLEHILQNLLSNAVKYSPEALPVEVDVRQEGAGIVVTVSDRGIGLRPGEHERLFENFYRSERVASIQGAGLGLSVCRRLVEAQGGTIWAEPREGGGAKFSFSLPRFDRGESPSL